MPLFEEKIYTVTAITRAIKYILEESYPSIWVEGEVSNYIYHSSGHRYLSLKDENASLKLTIWRSVGQFLKFEPEDGMKIRAFGDISVYEKGGNYQLNVRKLVPVGVGELEIAFRQLFDKLSKEGLFDEERKKPLPGYPFKIGLVTSPTGAAVRDIIQISQRRNNSVQLVIYPALVQGEGSEESLIAGLKYFDERADIDVVIIGRGGGSLEDLWVFNSESLVRAIASARKPIVSAIGHEIDTTLADLAADLRAPTPSAAAELVVWDKGACQINLQELVNNMTESLVLNIGHHRDTIKNIIGRPIFARPETLIREQEQSLDNLRGRLSMAGKILLEKQKNALSLKLSRLETLSPLAILNRGYAVLKKLPANVPIKSVIGLRENDLVEAVLADGSALATIKTVIRSDGQNEREKEV